MVCRESVGNCLAKTFSSFAARNFRIFTAGMFISSIGGWMQGMALGWLVYRLTGSVSDLGLVLFAGNLPLLFLLFIGGIVADRLDKRKILFVCNTVAMLQALLLAYLVSTKQATLSSIIALSVILGCTIAFEVPARQSLVPTLITDKEALANALGLSSSSTHIARMIGPAVGGFLIANWGEELCFAINAASFTAALVALLMLRLPESHKQGASLSTQACTRMSRWAACAGMLWEILKRPGIYTLLFLAAFVTTFGLQYTVLMPVIVAQLLHGQAVAYGLLSTAAGIGALAGSLTTAYIGHKRGRRLRIGFAAAALSGSLLLLAHSQELALSMVAVVVAGICLAMHWNGGNSLMQQCVEPHCRGKLMGIYTTFTLGLAPFTALLAGWTAERFGASLALLYSALCLFVGALLYLLQVHKLEDTCAHTDTSQ